jgi:hypothetical protein
LQKAVTQALAKAGTERVLLPKDFSHMCATHAHLGHIDVRPCLCLIKDKAENKGEWKQCAFWARKVEAGKETTLWRVDGKSEVVSEVAINTNGLHQVKLTWEGYIETKGERLTRLLLSARGQEDLEYAKDNHPLKKAKKDEVAFLPAGRPVDVHCGVRYGILGEPVAAAEAETPSGAAEPAEEFPDEARKQLVEVLGGPFLIFRDKVQAELKLSEKQKQTLLARFPEHVRETMKVFEKIKDLKPPEREEQMQEHRRKSDAKLTALLQDVLEARQQERLFQLQLQQAGVFALLGQNEAFTKLNITEEQRKKFMEVVQEMHARMQASIKKAAADGKPEEIPSLVRQIRREHASRIEALLSAAQQKQWKELLGKPFELGD